jgi:hypothetical protein
MLQQGLLPFKLERTDELITPRSGLALFAELVRGFKIEQRVERTFRRPGSNRGYEAWFYILPLLLMIEGRHIKHLLFIRGEDWHKCQSCQITRLPAAKNEVISYARLERFLAKKELQ